MRRALLVGAFLGVSLIGLAVRRHRSPHAPVTEVSAGPVTVTTGAPGGDGKQTTSTSRVPKLAPVPHWSTEAPHAALVERLVHQKTVEFASAAGVDRQRLQEVVDTLNSEADILFEQLEPAYAAEGKERTQIQQRFRTSLGDLMKKTTSALDALGPRAAEARERLNVMPSHFLNAANDGKLVRYVDTFGRKITPEMLAKQN